MDRFSAHLKKFIGFMTDLYPEEDISLQLDEKASKLRDMCLSYVNYSSTTDQDQQAVEFVEYLERGCYLKRGIPILRLVSREWLESKENVLYTGERKFPMYKIYSDNTSDPLCASAFTLHLCRLTYLALECSQGEFDGDLLGNDNYREKIKEKLRKNIDDLSRRHSCEPLLGSVATTQNNNPVSGGIDELLGPGGSKIFDSLLKLVSENANELIMPFVEKMEKGAPETDPVKGKEMFDKIVNSDEGKDAMRSILECTKGSNSIGEMCSKMMSVVSDAESPINKHIKTMFEKDASGCDTCVSAGGNQLTGADCD